MRNISIKGFLFSILLLFFHELKGQYEIASFSNIKEEYPEDNIIMLSKDIELNIDIKNEKPVIRMFTRERILYLKNSKGIEQQQYSFTSPFYKLVSFEANAYNLENGKYKKLPVKEYDEIKKFEKGVFFDDQTRLVFKYTGISEGSVIELNTEHLISEPRLIGSIFINEYIPVRDFKFTLNCDENVELDFIRINFPEDSGRISVIIKNGRKIYSLEKQKLENLKSENLQPAIRYYNPHLIPVIKSYMVSNKKNVILENVNDLYLWYTSFLKDIDQNIDHAGLAKIVEQVTDPEMTELEKIEKLYYWVQTNIKYIAFEDGMNGFIPRKADDVLNKRYGDCKDKTSLIHSLLKEAGITSYFTWIGTRDLPYSYSEVYTPLASDHMIITCINDGHYYFLDGTGYYQNINIPTSFIQGKEALIAIDKDRYEIKKVPVIPAEENQNKDSVFLEIQNNNLYGKGYKNLSGYPKIDLLYTLNTDDETSRKNSLEEMIQLGNNRFVLNDYKLTAGDNFSENIDFEYSFTLSNFASTIGTDCYLNLNLNKQLLSYKFDKERQNPLMLDHTLILEYVIVLKLPQGYTVEYLPPDSKFISDNCSFLIDYEIKDNQVVYRHKATIDCIFLKKDHFNDWNNFISMLEKNYKETIKINKGNEI